MFRDWESDRVDETCKIEEEMRRDEEVDLDWTKMSRRLDG